MKKILKGDFSMKKIRTIAVLIIFVVIGGTVGALKSYAVETDPIFLKENISEVFNTSWGDCYVTVKENKLYYTDGYNGKFEEYLPKNELNPDIHRQVYDLTRTLLKFDGFKVRSKYLISDDPVNKPEDNIVTVGITPDHVILGYPLWAFFFQEEAVNEEDSHIWLALDTLYKNDGTDANYKKEFKVSCEAVFGNETGEKIYNYIISEDEYIFKLVDEKWEEFSDGKCAFEHIKVIDNIEVKSTFTSTNQLYFDFKILEKVGE